MVSDQFIQSIRSVLIGKITIILLGIAFTPIIVRIITRSEYGIFSAVMASYSILGVISGFGLFDSMRNFVAANADSRESQINILFIGIVLSVVSTAVVTISTYLVYTHVELTRIDSELILILPSLLGRNISLVFRGYYYGVRKERISEKLKILRKSIFVFSAIGLATLSYGVEGVLLSYVLAIYAESLVYIIISIRKEPILMVKFSNYKYLIKLIRYSGFSTLGGASAALLFKLDILLVSYFLNPSKTALYAAALVPAEYIWIIPSVLQSTQLQEISNYWSGGYISKINNVIQFSFKYGYAGLLLVTIGIFGLADEFILIYFGGSYTGSVLPLRILLFGTFCFGIARILIPIFKSTGQVVHTESITFLTLIINVILNIILIPAFGVVGAAVGTTTSYVFVLIAHIFLWRQNAFELIPTDDRWKLIVLSITFAALYLSFAIYFPYGTVLSMLGIPIYGLIIFIILTIKLDFINELSNLR